MKKFLALAGLLACVLAIPAFAGNGGYPHWKSADLNFRTNAAAYAAPGNRDSSTNTLGLKATIDTTVAWMPTDWALSTNQAAGSESLQVIGVQILTANALAASETLYVSLECGSGDGGTWTSTLPGTSAPATSRAGGFDSGVAVVAGTGTTNGFILFGGWHPLAATSNGVVGGLQFNRRAIYGGWYGCPGLRVKVVNDISTDSVANTYRVRLWYWSTSTD